MIIKQVGLNNAFDIAAILVAAYFSGAYKIKGALQIINRSYADKVPGVYTVHRGYLPNQTVSWNQFTLRSDRPYPITSRRHEPLR